MSKIIFCSSFDLFKFLTSFWILSLKSLPIPDVEEEKVEEDTNLRWTVMNKQKPHLYIIDPYDLNSSPVTIGVMSTLFVMDRYCS